MRRILCSDWLPERARWSDTARPELPVSFSQIKFRKVQAGARKFSFAEIIFLQGKKIFVNSLSLWNQKTGKPKASKQRKQKCWGFQKYVLQKKPQNTKVKTQTDMKAWRRFCFQQHKNSELCDIPADELNLLLCKFFKTVKKLDGTEYEPISLTCLQRFQSLQRSLN